MRLVCSGLLVLLVVATTTACGEAPENLTAGVTVVAAGIEPSLAGRGSVCVVTVELDGTDAVVSGADVGVGIDVGPGATSDERQTRAFAVQGAGTGGVRQFSYTVVGDEQQGARPVLVTIDGVVRSTLLVELDFASPVPERVSFDLIDDDGGAHPVPDVVQGGERAQVRVSLAEAAGAGAAVATVDETGGADAWVLVSTADGEIVFEHRLPQLPGRYDVALTLQDPAGNARVDEVGGFVVDAAAPALVAALMAPGVIRPGEDATLTLVADEPIAFVDELVWSHDALALSATAAPVVDGATVVIPLRDVGLPDGTMSFTGGLVRVSLVDGAGRTRVVDVESAPMLRDATLTVDDAPPALHGLVVTPAVVSRAAGFDELVVEFVTSAALSERELAIAVAGRPVDHAQCTAIPVEDETSPAEPELVVRCARRVLPDDVEGVLPVTVAARDAAGNGAVLASATTLDVTAPAIGAVAVRLVTAADNPLLSATAVGPGTSIEVQLEVSEPLLPIVDADGNDTVAAVLSSTPAGFTFVGALVGSSLLFVSTADGLPPDGEVALSLELVDRAGNRATHLLAGYAAAIDCGGAIGGCLIVDTAAPRAPDPDRFTLEEAPWGSATSGGRPDVAVIADADADTSVGEDVSIRYEVAGVVVGGAPGLRVSLPQAQGVEVRFVDAAGNMSAPAALSKVRWIASLGGKVAGSSFPNPHSLVSTPRFSRRLEQDETDASGGEAAFPDGAAAIASSLGPRWRPLPLARPTLAPRASPGVAYDARRGALVVVSGHRVAGDVLADAATFRDGWSAPQPVPGSFTVGDEVAAVYSDVEDRTIVLLGDQTLGFDGERFEQLLPEHQPPRRRSPRLAYDADRGRVVLFSGGYVGDTWEWDGVDWHDVTPSTSPAPRNHHALTYDRRRGRVVLFGGALAETGGTSDMWEWDGAAWVERATVAPPAGEYAAIAVDERNDELVLVNGRGETWLLGDDDDAWTQATAQADVPARGGHRLVWNRQMQRTLLYGGYGGGYGGLVDGLWAWDGAAWGQVDAAVAVGPRRSPAAAYSPALGAVVVAGTSESTTTGSVALTPLGSSTSVAPLSTNDPRRTGAVLVYQESAGRSVLLGGYAGYGAVSALDTVALADDTRAWATVATTGSPPGRLSGSAAFDAARDAVVLFGGFTAPNSRTSALNDTWMLVGSTWTEAATNARPSVRGGAAMSYDPGRQRTVLFGGGYGTSTFGDTWEWDGDRWDRVATTGPLPRSDAAMAYAPALGGVVLFGGTMTGGLGQPVLADDTWVWDGERWSSLAPAKAPPGRAGHALVYDELDDRLVLFGGRVADEAGVEAPTDDVWVFDDDAGDRPAHVLEIVLAAADFDVDAVEDIDVSFVVHSDGDGVDDDVDLLVWDRGEWRALPTTVGNGAVRAQLPVERTLFIEPTRSLFFAVTPRGAAGARGASLAVDAVEVAVTAARGAR
jgi:hypothetical protein